MNSPFRGKFILFFAQSYSVEVLTLGDCIARANSCAAATADAGVGIDLVDFTLGDCLYRANRLASAASDAVITNYVGHSCSFL